MATKAATKKVTVLDISKLSKPELLNLVAAYSSREGDLIRQNDTLNATNTAMAKDIMNLNAKLTEAGKVKNQAKVMAVYRKALNGIFKIVTDARSEINKLEKS